MDETWDMNMHMNPIDAETKEILAKHKGLLVNNSDDFVTYVKANENARINNIRYQIYLEKLKDFAYADEPVQQ